jgi:uncharacterized protein (DUF1501 family)
MPSQEKPMREKTFNRRRLLQLGGGVMAGAMGAGSIAFMAPKMARAQSGYKALVCLFLYGGNDGTNMVVPNDASRHNQYATVRGALALPRSSLVGLAGTDFGLHPAMSALAPVWASGDLAPVFNLGPLYAPLTKAEYRNAPPSSPLVPDSLFSHSDQQVLWESSGTDALERTGWGGRAVAALNAGSPVISVGGNGRFGLSALGSPLVLPGPGAGFGLNGLDDTWDPVVARKTALAALYNQSQGNVLGDVYAARQREAMEVADRLSGLVKVLPRDGISTLIDSAFAPLTNAQGGLTTRLGAQLYQIAKLIEGRTTVRGSQHIFFAQMGGFDTHSAQVSTNSQSGDHAGLLKELGDAMACFHAAMVALGLSDQVTFFTQSDFGRTFATNSSNGTDHAWGNHHLVMGGAVNGRVTYGTYPELVLGGRDDVGVDAWERQGRWIPGLGVDQYAASFLRWMGASDTQLNTVLPNLPNFGSARTVGFL